MAGAVPADGAVLVVEVPEDAKLFINGIETSLTGSVRHFFTSGLADDKRYSYDVRVTRRGAEDQVETVWLEAGQQRIVSLGSTTTPVAMEKQAAAAAKAIAASGDVTTHLTLHVPSDARVWIAGSATSRTGAVRHFSTTSLAEGQTWDDYEVRVVASVNGQDEEVIKKVTLTGGRDVEITIDPGLQSASVVATASLR